MKKKEKKKRNIHYTSEDSFTNELSQKKKFSCYILHVGFTQRVGSEQDLLFSKLLNTLEQFLPFGYFYLSKKKKNGPNNSAIYMIIVIETHSAIFFFYKRFIFVVFFFNFPKRKSFFFLFNFLSFYFLVCFLLFCYLLNHLIPIR